MTSILTNNSAMVALETLRGINRSMTTVQNEISTGKKIASARDNSALWAISTVMRTDVQGFKQIAESLNLGVSSIAVARSAAETVTEVLNEIKGLIVAAQGGAVDNQKLQADIEAKRETIASIVSSAQFNGLNLINSPATPTLPGPPVVPGNEMQVLGSLDRDSLGNVTPTFIVVDRQDLRTVAGGGLANLMTMDVTAAAGAVDTTLSGAADALEVIEDLLQTSINAAAAFGSAQNRLETQGQVVQKLVDSLTTGIGTLVDADMEAASARLQALQVQKQLGVQALSIANQSPQTLLNLFR